MYRLEGRIQPYAWGGKNYIPCLLKQENKERMPYAEYWLGTHVGAPSGVFLGQSANSSLPSLINSDPLRYLGEAVLSQFGRLPFLLKILDVENMLSIQVHPSKQAAERGFARENQEGIPLDAPHRNYKDDNHKPEMMVAISEFWLLHGFSPSIPTVLDAYPFFHPFKAVYAEGNIKELYKKLMELPQQEVDALLQPYADQILPLYQAGQLDKESPDFWAARAMLNPSSTGHVDRGIFSIYLLNIVHLHPGEAIFQVSGMPHAYLEGQNIELMSNSDNVLRAGLTPKHVDVAELLANTECVPTHVQVIPAAVGKTIQQIASPVPDFHLSIVRLENGEHIELSDQGPRVLLVLDGVTHWTGSNTLQTYGMAAVFALPGEKIHVEAASPLTIFIAGVPV